MTTGTIQQTTAGYLATVAGIQVTHAVETVAKNSAATQAHKAGLIAGEDVDWGDDHLTRYVAPSSVGSGGFDTPIKGTRPV